MWLQKKRDGNCLGNGFICDARNIFVQMGIFLSYYFLRLDTDLAISPITESFSFNLSYNIHIFLRGIYDLLFYRKFLLLGIAICFLIRFFFMVENVYCPMEVFSLSYFIAFSVRSFNLMDFWCIFLFPGDILLNSIKNINIRIDCDPSWSYRSLSCFGSSGKFIFFVVLFLMILYNL